MYEKILVPLDGSKRAEKILSHVIEISQCMGSKIILLEVVIPAYYVLDPQVSFMDVNIEETKYRVEEAKSYLEKVQDKLSKQGLRVESVVEQGTIVETVIDIARKKDVDLIAMASHGRSGLGRVFYGSVSAGLLQQIDRPLLLIRSRDED
ncbi:MAG: universal stress protein [Anaerolineae bacterium]|nr:universal stress protein [Anaerolineae bacterium]